MTSGSVDVVANEIEVSLSKKSTGTLFSLENFSRYVFVVLLFFPVPLGEMVPQFMFYPCLVVILLLVELTNIPEISRQTAKSSFALCLFIFLIGFAFVLISLLSGGHLGPGTFAVFLITFPTSFLLGKILVKGNKLDRYLVIYQQVSLAVAVLAIYEWGTSSRIFVSSRATYVDPSRASVGLDHPIILGMFLALAIPVFSTFTKSAIYKYTSVFLLLFGVYASGSSGPLAIAIGATVIFNIDILQKIWIKSGKTLSWILFPVLGYCAYLAYNVWQPIIADYTIDQYSDGYRVALYALVPQFLKDAPLGFGPEGLPPNSYFIFSLFRGIRDVSVSVDSEIAFLIVKFGLVGLVFFVWQFWLGLRRLQDSPLCASMLVMISLTGTVVALHAWNTTSVLWFLLIGVCFASRTNAETSPISK